MSRKFKKPIETYQVGRLTPMAIELDKSVSGLGKYAKLADNPIYYYNSLQYKGGGFYRAILGYEVIWDPKKERQLNLCLDYFLTHQRDHDRYYFEELKVNRDWRIHGVPWPRGVAPKQLSFAQEWPYELKEGETLTARINSLDKPYHVDIERSNGEVFTIRFPRYELFRKKQTIKENRYESQRKRNAVKSPTGKGPGASLVSRFSRKNPTQELSDKVLAMRQRRRWETAL